MSQLEKKYKRNI